MVIELTESDAYTCYPPGSPSPRRYPNSKRDRSAPRVSKSLVSFEVAQVPVSCFVAGSCLLASISTITYRPVD